MQRNPRSTQRIDYRLLHETGEKSVIEEVTELLEKTTISETSPEKIIPDIATMATSATEDIKDNLLLDIDTISDEIEDFISEHDIIADLLSVEDIDRNIEDVNALRTSFRRKHKELKTLVNDYEDSYLPSYNDSITQIKDYIMKATEVRHKHRMKDFVKEKEREANEGRQMKFIIEDITRILTEIDYEGKTKVKEITDDELLTRKDEIPNLSKKLHGASSNISNLFKFQNNKEVDAIILRYESTFKLFAEYEDEVKREVEHREISKTKLFQESKLNIKMCKFSGYDSKMDIYTFQTNFEKLYAKTVPKRVMPDYLKNNLLEGSALCMVKSLDSIDEIWKRLKTAYGDPKVMLTRKLKDLNKLDIAWKSNSERVVEDIGRLINLMKDLILLCTQHKIEAKLYNSDALERIYKVMGKAHVTRWLNSIYDDTDVDDRQLWQKLLKFLEKDLNIQQQTSMFLRKTTTERKGDWKESFKKAHYVRNDNDEEQSSNETAYSASSNLTCAICGCTDHVATTAGSSGTKVVQYFTCKLFAEMTPKQRFITLRSKKLCFQCLFPHASSLHGKHRDGKCQKEFTCKHPSHDRYNLKKHVLVCDDHKESDENKALLKEYKERCILYHKSVNLPIHAKDISLTFYSTYKVNQKKPSASKTIVEETINDKAIYQLQTISIDGQSYTIFYDSGCSDFVSRHSAIERMGHRARCEQTGPINLGGVGGISTQSKHGIYTVKLPTSSGKDIMMTGVCLEQITATFPNYPLSGKVKEDIHDAYKAQQGDPSRLPKLPKFVGGDTDFMIGIKYLRYHPKAVFQLPSGLTIYESVFENSEGGYGVVGGPHEVFSAIENYYNLAIQGQTSFFSNQLQLYERGFQVNPDISMIGFKHDDTNLLDDSSIDDTVAYNMRRIKLFTQVEDTGTSIMYRCVKCRLCKTCKDHDRIEELSIKEEVEQEVIDRSVEVDVINRRTIATLPFMRDPSSKLAPNKAVAMKVFNQQLRKLSRNTKDKEDIIKSESKLQALGHVDYLRNLTEEQQKMLNEHPIQNFIPWRAVWKESSISTPCRIVFDASQPTSSGFSLNDLLAKGVNSMNKLQEVFIRWMIHKVAFHTDIQKMYNSIKLKESHWCFQRYIWQEHLDPEMIPEEKIIKTLIYGVKSSGNQAERGLRETAIISKHQYPEAAKIVCKDIYVDDCMSGENMYDTTKTRADELELILNRGGFTLKGVTISGDDPSENLSDDGKSLCVAGMKWWPKDDVLTLDIGELCFAKRVRGKRIITEESRRIPEKLTRRQCTSKVAEVFDIVGKVAPVIASFKLDLHDLIIKKLDWDDPIPNELKQVWVENFQKIQELKELRFKRALVPSDATSLQIETLDFGDASKQMACVAIYARFRRSNGEFSCQLVLSRTKIIPDGTTQPRAELIAALMNAHSGEIVKRSFGEKHARQLKLSDSEIALYWLQNDEKPLKEMVRNRVIEIRRFTRLQDWFHVDGTNMIADIGTRKGAELEDVNPESAWINGYNWMRKDITEMPIRKVDTIKLTSEMKSEVNKELPKNIPSLQANHIVLQKDEIQRRYELSNYIVDPVKHKFSSVVRIVAIVLKFIQAVRKKSKTKTNQDVFQLNDDDIKRALNYYYRKGTMEVKEFNKPSFYNKFCSERDGILYYNGRILPDDEVSISGKFTNSMIDLCNSTFCVPVLDKYSPISYSIVNDIHWNDKEVKHRGIETVWRAVLKLVFIIEGRSIVKAYRINCQRCRYLNKRAIDVAMGPVSRCNLMIAPAFYMSQVDLAGPFPSYSPHHKRTTVKVWMAVFCCSTTSTVSIKIMDSYSSPSFIQAVIRLACEVGYPKKLYPDEGSQLLKSCEDVQFNYRDVKNKLYTDAKIDFEPCPVGAHYMHGRVERKIREVKLSIERSIQNERLSILQWETLAAEIANSLNDMPLALGSKTSDFEVADILTPNRLRLGRNNNRSPDGIVEVSSDPDRFFKQNKRIFESWFEVWLMSHLPVLMFQPKWYKTSHHIKVGDIVLFTKQESSLKAKYQYGIVDSTERDKDGIVRKVRVKYCNVTESTHRYTNRSTRDLIVIHAVDETDIAQQLGEIAILADVKFKNHMINLH